MQPRTVGASIPSDNHALMSRRRGDQSQTYLYYIITFLLLHKPSCKLEQIETAENPEPSRRDTLETRDFLHSFVGCTFT